MHLKYLSISQYKNISYKTYDFESKINCFIGDNGKGKSNILDAIYNLSFGKSYFNTVAVQNIQFGKIIILLRVDTIEKSRVKNFICNKKRSKEKL